MARAQATAPKRATLRAKTAIAMAAGNGRTSGRSGAPPRQAPGRPRGRRDPGPAGREPAVRRTRSTPGPGLPPPACRVVFPRAPAPAAPLPPRPRDHAPRAAGVSSRCRSSASPSRRSSSHCAATAAAADGILLGVLVRAVEDRADASALLDLEDGRWTDAPRCGLSVLLRLFRSSSTSFRSRADRLGAVAPLGRRASTSASAWGVKSSASLSRRAASERSSARSSAVRRSSDSRSARIRRSASGTAAIREGRGARAPRRGAGTPRRAGTAASRPASRALARRVDSARLLLHPPAGPHDLGLDGDRRPGRPRPASGRGPRRGPGAPERRRLAPPGVGDARQLHRQGRVERVAVQDVLPDVGGRAEQRSVRPVSLLAEDVAPSRSQEVGRPVLAPVAVDHAQRSRLEVPVDGEADPVRLEVETYAQQAPRPADGAVARPRAPPPLRPRKAVERGDDRLAERRLPVSFGSRTRRSSASRPREVEPLEGPKPSTRIRSILRGPPARGGSGRPPREGVAAEGERESVTAPAPGVRRRGEAGVEVRGEAPLGRRPVGVPVRLGGGPVAER